MVWFATVFWIVPLIALIACWRFDAAVWLWALVLLALVCGVVQNIADYWKLRDLERRFAESRINANAA